ncbi:hypothetical protein BDZ45DRAFT_697789 [Acephala macrosclerotiorum]|nr:hypothetical protein BDZ45DRAFT_697789 [Acephala macrosclerotiorum]
MFANKRSRITDDRDTNLVPINLEKHPKGFPRLAAYVNSDADTVLARRFGDLHARILLYYQAELTDLEAQLAKLDADDAAKDEYLWRNAYSIHRDNGEGNEERTVLIEKIVQKLEEYDKLLFNESRNRKLPRPSERVHHNFMDYVYTENTIDKEDQRFIYHEHDFVTLQEYEESRLDELMHRFMGHCKHGPLKKLFVKRADREKTSDKHLHYYSADRLGTFMKILIATTSIALLLIPVYIFMTRNLSATLMTSVILIFAFAFAASISFSTNARRHEVFTATAAYCAVLVVFVGNLQQRTGSSSGSILS